MKLLPAGVNEETRDCYERLKRAFNLRTVPLFFQYIGAFPKYLAYITDQVVANAEDERFTELVTENCQMVRELMKEQFGKGKELSEMLFKYGQTPEFYYFEKDLSHIFEVNGKLAFLFIALREAVKGWAVAAKKLTDENKREKSEDRTGNGSIHEELVFGDFLEINSKFEIRNPKQIQSSNKQTDEQALAKRVGLVKKEQNAITEAVLPKYLTGARTEFEELLKTERLLYFRVELEKILIRGIDVLPHTVFSPINVTLALTKEYPHFVDLLYMLSEHFPTYAVQRWLFSGYLLP